jgi:NAD(P)-dependent dehydrogenase (short-subunit alcohol dehydrogenase family)
MKTILITGCSTGFGFNAAKYLADAGHHVIATMRNMASKNAPAADALREHAENKQVKLEVMEADVTSDESVAALAGQIPVIDVLINNAGVGYSGPVESFSADQVLAQLDLNIVGTVRMAKAVLPGMRARKSGLIIQVSSVAGRGAFPGFGVYHASKWGLEGLSETMRYELSPLGIDVVTVEPGPFETNFFPGIVYSEGDEVRNAYGHVDAFFQGFGEQVQAMFADENAPTDPMLVVKKFEELIETPAGQRPLRNVVGLDFGMDGYNVATEPVRKAILEAVEISDWDGPQG